jgi:hypothetical protein
LAPLEGHALFERRDDAGDVGVEAVELAVRARRTVLQAPILAESGSVCSRWGRISCLCGMVMETPWMGISLTSLSRSFELGGLQREVDGVDGLAAEGRVHHDGRERFADGVAGDAVDLGGGVDLVDAVGLDEGAGGDLAGAGLFAGVAAAKVKAEPARTPRTREMMPASPMQMPMMLVWSFMRSRKRMRVTLSRGTWRWGRS